MKKVSKRFFNPVFFCMFVPLKLETYDDEQIYNLVAPAEASRRTPAPLAQALRLRGTITLCLSADN